MTDILFNILFYLIVLRMFLFFIQLAWDIFMFTKCNDSSNLKPNDNSWLEFKVIRGLWNDS